MVKQNFPLPLNSDRIIYETSSLIRAEAAILKTITETKGKLTYSKMMSLLATKTKENKETLEVAVKNLLLKGKISVCEDTYFVTKGAYQ